MLHRITPIKPIFHFWSVISVIATVQGVKVSFNGHLSKIQPTAGLKFSDFYAKQGVFAASNKNNCFNTWLNVWYRPKK